MNATAGGASSECCNGAITLDPLGGLLFDQECVSIEGGPQGPNVSLFKYLGPGQSPTVAPGEPVLFQIRLINTGDQTADGGVIVDTLDPCFETISCFDVACAGGSQNGCGTCIETPDGFDIDSFTLDPFDPDELGWEMTIWVEATAGQTPGACTNTVLTVNPGTGGDISDDETITIEESGDTIFSDGFESGDTTAWSETVP